MKGRCSKWKEEERERERVWEVSSLIRMNIMIVMLVLEYVSSGMSLINNLVWYSVHLCSHMQTWIVIWQSKRDNDL